jgi:hypothetical protein
MSPAGDLGDRGALAGAVGIELVEVRISVGMEISRKALKMALKAHALPIRGIAIENGGRCITCMGALVANIDPKPARRGPAEPGASTGGNGSYALARGATYTAASGGRDEGDPLLHRIERVVDAGIIWAPAIAGSLVLTTRGGDFERDIGQEISIAYLSQSSTMVEFHLQETFTFRMLTSEAPMILEPVSP